MNRGVPMRGQKRDLKGATPERLAPCAIPYDFARKQPVAGGRSAMQDVAPPTLATVLCRGPSESELLMLRLPSSTETGAEGASGKPCRRGPFGCGSAWSRGTGGRSCESSR